MEPDILERIVDGREKPTNLPFALLKNITKHFSEDRVIGQGGFATVYKGVLRNGNVAVKRIRNNHSIDDKLFYREVDSLLMISHQNIVRFLGFCASTDQTAIKIEGSRQHIYAEIRERLLCFEYISNGSLQKYITDELRGLEWNKRYQIIRGICEGLHHLHKEKHVYHMDLKPANILLDNHMVPKITDFGLSRLDEKSQTMSENRFGSLGYCAPEYLHSGKMSFKSDIFSLGIIITEVVVGDKGIPDNNKNNVLRRWMHRWRKSGMETLSACQQVAKCMEIGLLCQEIDPAKRPFIWDLIHDIRELDSINGTTTNACEYTFGQISPYPEDDMLGVDPLELHFPFELNTQMSCSLQLTNETDSYIAFNIQNMSPLPYCTQPNKDIVPPRSKCSVDITLHPQDKTPQDMQRADEFIVWSTKVNDGLAAEDITISMFSTDSGLVDAMNLDVVFDAEESATVSKELILHSITEDMSNIKTDGTVGDVKKSKECLLPTPLWLSSTGRQNHQEAAKASSETQQASHKTSEKSTGSIKIPKGDRSKRVITNKSTLTCHATSSALERETLSPCMVDAQGFEHVYKMRRSTFSYVCSLVRIPILEDMKLRDHVFVDGRVLSLQDRVAVALRMLNSGDPPEIVGASIGVHKSTALLVTQVFVKALCNDERLYACWPRSSSKMEKIKHEFDKIHGLPNCCGVVHIAHIRFGSQNPDHEENGGTLLQVVVGPDMRFTTICLGSSDSVNLRSILHFSYLFKESEKGTWLNGTKMDLSDGSDVGEYIIGDPGYPLRPWLLTPYQLEGDLSDSDYKKEFNRRHSEATSAVVPRALARLKDTWKCLQGEGWHPNEFAQLTIGTCCLLHNIVIDMEEAAGTLSTEGVNFSHQVRQLAYEDAVSVRDALSQHFIGLEQRRHKK